MIILAVLRPDFGRRLLKLIHLCVVFRFASVDIRIQYDKLRRLIFYDFPLLDFTAGHNIIFDVITTKCRRIHKMLDIQCKSNRPIIVKISVYSHLCSFYINQPITILI